MSLAMDARTENLMLLWLYEEVVRMGIWLVAERDWMLYGALPPTAHGPGAPSASADHPRRDVGVGPGVKR